MQVTVAVHGKFHAFKLAGELARLGHLHRLVTTYPAFVAIRDGIPAGKIRAIPAIGAMAVVGVRLFDPLSVAHITGRAYAAAARRLIGHPDVCVAWSGTALPVLREAKERGALTVVERGSLHILAQREILEREYDRLGLRVRSFHEGIVQSELAEYELADRIAVPTRIAARSFLERGIPPEKIIQVPYGVDLARFSPSPKRDRGFRVLSVGRLSIQKGTHLLLEACAPLAGMHGFELHLVGPVLKEMKPFLSKYAGTFRHTGAVEHALLPDVYSQASLFVLPSLQEGLAMVQAEAMACGLPLVCTPSTGCEDLFTHGVQGLIVQPGDVLALRQAILDLYHDPARRDAMAAAAIARASEALTWQRYGESIAAAYQEALRSKASD